MRSVKLICEPNRDSRCLWLAAIGGVEFLARSNGTGQYALCSVTQMARFLQGKGEFVPCRRQIGLHPLFSRCRRKAFGDGSLWLFHDFLLR